MIQASTGCQPVRPEHRINGAPEGGDKFDLQMPLLQDVVLKKEQGRKATESRSMFRSKF